MYKIKLIGIIVLLSLITGCEPYDGVGSEYETEEEETPPYDVFDGIPKNLTCYNTSFYLYHGELNDTCYFLKCMELCYKNEIDYYCLSQEHKIDSMCVYEYLDCVEECFEDLEWGYVEDYDVHKFGCLINETIENETRCY